MLKLLVSFGDFHMLVSLLGYMFMMFGYYHMSVFPAGIYVLDDNCGGVGVDYSWWISYVHKKTSLVKLSNLDLWSSKLNGQALWSRSNPAMVGAGALIGN